MRIYLLFILTLALAGCCGCDETMTNHGPVGHGLYGAESVGAGGK